MYGINADLTDYTNDKNNKLSASDTTNKNDAILYPNEKNQIQEGGDWSNLEEEEGNEIIVDLDPDNILQLCDGSEDCRNDVRVLFFAFTFFPHLYVLELFLRKKSATESTDIFFILN